MADDNRILLHVCCGPCATASIERLLELGWKPVLYFSNSNIHPYEEFVKRYKEAVKVAGYGSLEIYMDEYRHDLWLERIRGHEGDPEHGARCSLCFRFSLERACEKARELGIDHFTTTLTISRFKNSAVIFRQAEELEGFEAIDFKKKNGFNRSVELSKMLGLYRQQWCGCEFSYRVEKE